MLRFICTMEASMHGSSNRSGETTEDSFYQRWGTGFLVLPVVLVIALIGLAIIQPATTNWIADEVMAEFTGANYGPQAVPTQVAKATR
jgi:hypothetical protein